MVTMGKTVKILVIAVSLTLLATLLPSGFFPVYAADEHTLVVEVLEGANRSPIANANVSIYGPANQSELSGYDGRAIFSSLPVGNYLIITSAPGYTVKSSQDVLLDDDKTVTLLFSTTEAFFVYSPTVITTNDNIFFNASLSNSSGVIISYEWDFGDNTTGTNRTTNHTYTKPGEYRVSLTVTSDVGVAKYAQTIMVNSSSNNFWIYQLFLILLVPLIIFILLRRRRYYVVIQARVPDDKKSEAP